MLLMGRGRPRAVEKGGGLGQIACSSGNGTMNVPLGPVYYPNEEEFKDPLGFIYKIRAEAEPYGICKIVPPKSWKPPFALDLNKFRFPTKTQAIHQLQARPASCDSKTFELEYNRFLEARCGRKTKRKVVFEGEELDLCKLFNAVKRFGGSDKVVKDKKWGEVFRFVRSGRKISECAKHVLCQLYREHLYDYEDYYNKLNNGEAKNCKRGTHIVRKSDRRSESSSSKKRRKINHGEVVKLEVEEKVESRDQICVQCKSGLHGEVMLLCDRCNKGWHTYCLSPPLEAIPLGNWYCLECLNSDKDSFGFVPGKHFSLEAFRRVADRTKKRWFGQASCSPSQLEKKFWEIVEGSLGEVEVMYGSDLDTSIYGSGFPRANDQRLESVDTEIWDEYCSSPWNLNNLPKLKDSMLRTVHHSIAGVMVPWLYIGMLFSAFCWHFEDHCFYSMNYHHWGEPKCWYSVPGSEASTFEKVMRSCLPDLFDSQPDLLFQLVTMLNPSVLQENGVPVYGVLQEPGNFVITFPRSYHGGFNLGLNCAEAVNFAPADWLPHGGFGAELYQTYHKPAVLSHEELLCVVAKTGCDEKVSFYLNKELLRVFSKEKNWREKLWKKGVVKTSVMSPRSHPEFVGTEEDPICIICQQYLYLSAVVCCCRPSTFVCLEHWEHLCECNPKKRCLLYRHSLAELNELLARTGNVDCDENPTLRSLQRQSSCSTDSGTLTKKVKCRQVSLAQLAEEWLLSSCKIFQLPFSSDAYAKALKAAQQFLWAGSEMDPVRDMVKNLSEAKDWAESVRQCLSLVEKWSDNSESDLEKVHLERISNLLKYDPAPCTEPGYPKLKDYAEGARKLVQEICDGLSESPLSISELEHLYDKANGFPIHVKESDKLLDKISSAKACVGNVRKCVLETCPSAVEMDTLHHLKSKIVELQVQVPETEMLLDIIRKAELCQTRCKEMLKDQFTLKELELLIHDFGSLVVNIPEFKLLQQYHSDAISWISRFNQIQNNIHEREDHENVVKELECIQKDAAVLRVQVDELALVDFELKRACCREKAAKARSTKMPLDFIKQVLSEAFMLQIEKEKLFVSISEALGVALSWEDCAQQILSIQAHMRDFEDAMRTSEDLFVVLPSLNAIKNAVSAAKSWLESSKPFLKIGSYASDSLLSFDALKEQVSHSKHLKVLLEERMAIENVLQKCEEWRNCSSSLLKDVGNLLNKEDNCNILGDDLMLKTEELLNRVESVKATGTSMGFDFSEISELQNACSSLQWCGKVLSFRFKIPSLKEVNSLIEVVNELAPVYRNAFLCTLLLDGITWLKKVTEVLPASSNGRGGKRFQLADAAEILMESQKIRVSFPVIIRQIEQAIEKHRTWEEEVNAFFGLNSSERSWSSLLLLKELAKDAFCCKELDMVLSEVEMVEKWKQRSEEVVGSSNRDVASLSKSLLKIKQSMHRSLYIYKKSKCSKVGYFCTGCSNNSEDQEFMTCSSCKDCYHLRCLVPTLVGINDPKVYVCPYCVSVESGSICRSRDSPLRFKGKRPELERLVELSSDAKEFSVSNEEKDTLQEIVDQALVCRANLSDIVDSVLTFLGQDLSSVSGKLTIAFKALDVAGVYDPLASHKFDLALARSSWRIRASKLLDGSQKPLIQHIQRHLKEGSAINIPPEDYYRQKLIEVKQAGTRWAEIAKKVATDNGELELDSVFELIEEGENLPVHFEKELKQLRDRSVLYCICRKPYDQRAMIACDECDEWYHFDCVNLVSPPKVYICPACDPQQEGKILFSMKTKQERSVDGKDGEPQTPSPRHTASRWRPRKAKPSRKQKQVVVAGGSSGSDRFSGGLDQLLWTNRKPFRRVAKKRADLGSLSLFFAS